MRIKITRELLISLRNKGYTVLVADVQINKELRIFIATKWDVEELLNHTFMYGYERDEILIIDEVLKSKEADLSNHELII